MRKKLFELFPEPVPTFDLILPTVRNWLEAYSGSLNYFLSNEDDWLLVNRDLNGRVRLILPERIKESEQRMLWNSLASSLMQRLGKHAYPQNAEILLRNKPRAGASRGNQLFGRWIHQCMDGGSAGNRGQLGTHSARI